MHIGTRHLWYNDTPDAASISPVESYRNFPRLFTADTTLMIPVIGMEGWKEGDASH